MEHPTGDFDSAVDVMEDGISRLRKLPSWDSWITFSAQGQGSTPDSYKFAEIRMRGDMLDPGDLSLDVPRIAKAAGVNPSSIEVSGSHYSIAGVSAREVACLLDAIFRLHFGIRPFAEDDGDYAVGAEW